jgi:hypothetical protein
MSMLDLSKIRYSSYFQGLGNIETSPEYEFDLPQINATRSGGPVIYSWTIPSSSHTFSIPVDRPDLLSSVLFSIRDVNTSLNIIDGTPWHSWATSIIGDANTSPTEYLSHYESMRGTYETQIGAPIIGGGVSGIDYFFIIHFGMFNTNTPALARLVIRCWLDGNNLVINVRIVSGEIGTGENGNNNPINKAIAASKLRIKLKRYIAPWNM